MTVQSGRAPFDEGFEQSGRLRATPFASGEHD
jgi:hypothetical protein